MNEIVDNHDAIRRTHNMITDLKASIYWSNHVIETLERQLVLLQAEKPAEPIMGPGR